MQVCTKCGKQKPSDQYYKNGKQGGHSRCKECYNDDRRFCKFGITPEDFKEMHIAQNYKCAICGSSDPGGRKAVASFMVDHCHTTGEVRGLLCHSCNLLLGHAKDSIETLQKAILYLENVR